ncbi:MAG: NAD(P)/FAD-dependent oxidoreductase [Candidatus Edwardsbacteria bacterium]
MKQSDLWDIVVVGAGPAGSCVAEPAARRGAKVLILENKSTIGIPVQCAEHIPKLLAGEVSFDKRCIAQEVKSLRLNFPSGKIEEISAPGYVLDRCLFDRELAMDAINSGAELHLKTRAISYSKGKLQIQTSNRRKEIEGKIFVGADGPLSIIGQSLGRVHQRFVKAAQAEVVLKENSTTAEIFFDQKFYGGYAWLFPKGKRANAGLGMETTSNKTLFLTLKEFLSKLEESNRIYLYSKLSVTFGLIPVSGYLDTVQENVLLVGDAAGQTNPLTGAGIASAILCGKMAGEAAVEAIISNSFSVLKEYESNWQKLFKNHLDKALKKREELLAHWHSSDFEKYLRHAWLE